MKFNKWWAAAIGVVNGLVFIASLFSINFFTGSRQTTKWEDFFIFFSFVLETVIMYFLTGWWAEKSLATENNSESPLTENTKKIYK